MQISVVGFNKVDYVNKNGKQIIGSQLFCVAPSQRSNSKGMIWVGKKNGFSYSPLFCSSSVVDPDKLSTGVYDMQFDLNGNISSMEKVKVE